MTLLLVLRSSLAGFVLLWLVLWSSLVSGFLLVLLVPSGSGSSLVFGFPGSLVSSGSLVFSGFPGFLVSPGFFWFLLVLPGLSSFSVSGFKC